MAKKQIEPLKVNCIYKDEGKTLEDIIKEAFLLYVKGELSKTDSPKKVYNYSAENPHKSGVFPPK
jgi:hypothetical protein